MTHDGPPIADLKIPPRRSHCSVCGSQCMNVSEIEVKLFCHDDPIAEISYRASCDVCGDSSSRTCSDVWLGQLVWKYIECVDLSSGGR